MTPSSWIDPLALGVRHGLLLLLLPLALFAPKGLPALMGGAAFLSMPGVWRHFGTWKAMGRYLKGFSLILGSLGLLILWAYLSAVWSIAPMNSLLATTQLFLWFVSGIVVLLAFAPMEGVAYIRGRNLFLMGFAIGLFFLTIEAFSEGCIHRFVVGDDFLFTRLNRVATVLSMLTFPVLWMVDCTLKTRLPSLARYGILTGGYVWIGLIIFRLDCDTAKVAFILSSAVFFIARLWPLFTAKVTMGVLAVLIMAAPLLPQTILKPDVATPITRHLTTKFSFYHRLHIYAFVASKIGERPLLGWGFDGARHRTFADQKRPHLQNPQYDMALVPIHPHNAALQVWLELGVVGAILLTLIAAFFPWSMVRGCRPGPGPWPFALGATISAVISALASFGLWQHWWLSALWLAALIVHTFVTGEGRDHIQR